MSQVKLRIINITDVYKLDNFPSLRTFIDEKKKEVSNEKGTQVISILTGDFLAPYLLSSLDKGTGMVAMLNALPIDYVTFGNHEDDLEHKYVVKRVADYKGIWLNTNMQSYEAFDKQKAFDIITVKSEDGSNERKIGLIALLTNTPNMYRKHPFGGAKIDDPYETMAKYKKILETEHNVDLIIPLCHLYEPQDEVTAQRFDFPVILSGHDHHVVNRTINKSLLLKAGSDADNAVLLDITWLKADTQRPTINAQICKIKGLPENKELRVRVDKAYSVLDKLKHSEVCPLPNIRPFTSVDSRSKLVPVAKFLWTCLRKALNTDDQQENSVDCVLCCGGELRGGRDYPEDKTYFSLEDLKSEISSKQRAIIVEIPGDVLSLGIVQSHERSNPGYVQIDDAVELDPKTGHILTIGGKPLDPKHKYRIATSFWEITDGPAKAWVEYFKEHPEEIPPPDADWPVYSMLISYFAKHVWKQLWTKIDKNQDGRISAEELCSFDTDRDGQLSKREVAHMMAKIGFEVDPDELGFIDCIMEVAGDVNKDGYLSLSELNNRGSPKV